MERPGTVEQRTQHKEISDAANIYSGTEKQIQEGAHMTKKEKKKKSKLEGTVKKQAWLIQLL